VPAAAVADASSAATVCIARVLAVLQALCRLKPLLRGPSRCSRLFACSSRGLLLLLLLWLYALLRVLPLLRLV
jgi:hypothetical protein